MYKKETLNTVDDKQSQQYKWLLNIVDLQRIIITKPAKVLIYAIIIVKQQNEIVINVGSSNNQMETRHTKNIFY